MKTHKKKKWEVRPTHNVRRNLYAWAIWGKNLVIPFVYKTSAERAMREMEFAGGTSPVDHLRTWPLKECKKTTPQKVNTCWDQDSETRIGISMR